MVFWFSIALLGILIAVFSVVNSKKYNKDEKKQSVFIILGVSAVLIIALIIVDNSDVIAELMS